MDELTTASSVTDLFQTLIWYLYCKPTFIRDLLDTNWFAMTNFTSKPYKDLCCYNNGLRLEIFETTMLSPTSRKFLVSE